jgi:hypothetical protein
MLLNAFHFLQPFRNTSAIDLLNSSQLNQGQLVTAQNLEKNAAFH